MCCVRRVRCGYGPGDEDDRGVETDGEDPLRGRLALVVDDDPRVVEFFSGLLRGAGMRVIERGEGLGALRDARVTRPDLVIADILMPGMDGFSLCRAIRRDVALRHVPVVLLSWREDLLNRMRELGAQAQGFLRKEARGEAILARVRGALRGRSRLQRRVESLGEADEVRGRLERIGAFALLESAARAPGGVTVTITDSFSVTELALREARAGDTAPWVSGKTLIDIEAGEYADPATQQQSKFLMRHLLGHHLGGTPLNTRQILIDLLQL